MDGDDDGFETVVDDLKACCGGGGASIARFMIDENTLERWK